MGEKQILDDEHIIELYWQREEKAIEETDNKYGELLFRIAYNVLNDKSDSEECQNDTYLAVWNAIPPTRPRVFPAFIVQIIRRISIDFYRRKNRKRSIPSEFKTTIDDLSYLLHSKEEIDAGLNAKELGKLISDYVKSLSKKQQYIFVSRFYMSNPIEYIANEMDVTASSIYKSIDKIKKGLKEYLTKRGVSL